MDDLNFCVWVLFMMLPILLYLYGFNVGLHDFCKISSVVSLEVLSYYLHLVDNRDYREC